MLKEIDGKIKLYEIQYSLTKDPPTNDVEEVAIARAGKNNVVYSPEELYVLLKRESKNGTKPIKDINYFGHTISLGTRTLSAVEKLTKDHPDILTFMAKDAKIVLWGCDAAVLENQAGMRGIAKLLDKSGGVVWAYTKTIGYKFGDLFHLTTDITPDKGGEWVKAEVVPGKADSAANVTFSKPGAGP